MRTAGIVAFCSYIKIGTKNATDVPFGVSQKTNKNRL